MILSVGKVFAVASSLLWQKLKEEGVITADRFRMIPYSAVGGSGLLPAVRTDFLECANTRCCGAFLAGAGEELKVAGGAFAESRRALRIVVAGHGAAMSEKRGKRNELLEGFAGKVESVYLQ